MGWEYHNRQRTEHGTFEHQDKSRALHVRCTPLEYETIRGRAYARKLSISEYIIDLVKRDLLRVRYDLEIPDVKPGTLTGNG